jgi:hypothetical protein
MLIVPTAAQATLAAYTDNELRSELHLALRNVAFAIWEAHRRGYELNQVGMEPLVGVPTSDQAREVRVILRKNLEL